MRDDEHELDALRVPPNSVEAEQSVLGALLLSNAALDRIVDRVSEADFYADHHRRIFSALSSLIGAGKPADVVTLAEVLRTRGDLDRIGGMPYLGGLVAAVPTAANIATYADIVRDKATRRATIAFAFDVQELAWARHGNAATLVDDVQRRAVELSMRGASTGDLEAIGGVLPRVVERIEDRWQRQTGPNEEPVFDGIATGLVDLDAKLCGLAPGDLVIIAGRPAMGKTTLAFQIAMHASVDKQKVGAVFSLEMERESLGERAVAHRGRVNSYALRAGRLNDQDWAQISGALGQLTNAPLYIDSSTPQTVERIRARTRRLRQRASGEIGLVVVDYLQLMSGDGENRQQEISGISRGLKLLAKELHCPVLALSQLNRSLEQRSDKRPMMSDLRESGALEQDADTILFVYRDEVYHAESQYKDIAEIIIGKQRNGEVGRVYTRFNGAHNRFDNLAKESMPVFSNKKSGGGYGRMKDGD